MPRRYAPSKPYGMSRRALMTSALGAVGAAATGSLPTSTVAVAQPASAGAQPPSARLARAPSTAPMADPYAAPTVTGPSSQPVPAIGITPAAPETPYLVPVARGWHITSLLTAGNAVGGYRLTGVPDGLGAFDNGDGTITLLVNHELDAGHGTMRGHGGKGAFVSRWVIDINTLEVLSGRDFVASPEKLNLWSDGKWVPASAVAAKPAPVIAVPAPTASSPDATVPAATTPAGMGGAAMPVAPPPVEITPRDLDRFCSADLAPKSAYYDHKTGRGYDGHIFLNGEEGENRANRAFAWVAEEDAAYELPAFSHGTPGSEDDPPPSWENLLANPATGTTTLVLANSDGGTSHVYAYIGAKRAEGSAIERAGLADGRLFSLRVAGVKQEDRKRNIGLTKSRLGRGDAKRVGLVGPGDGTAFLRPEDGAWDPRDPRVYYFATTHQENYASGSSFEQGKDPKQAGRSRLWAVTFDNIHRIAMDGRPTAKIQLLLDGTEGGDMFDNITVDRHGIVYLCEDTGEARHTSKVWAYDTHSGRLTPSMRVDPEKFGSFDKGVYVPPTPPFVDDKEISGILDVTGLFAEADWYREGSTVLVTTVQAHFGYDGNDAAGLEINEGGQLLLLVKEP